MFFQGVSSVLLLDKSGNDMLRSILFLSLGFDVLTDHFYWWPSCRQKAETLAPECFFPKFFPDFRILFFQQPAAGTFICIDKFTEYIEFTLTLEFSFSFKFFYLIDWFYYTMNRIAEQVFFSVFCNSSPTYRGRRILAIYYVKFFMRPP